MINQLVFSLKIAHKSPATVLWLVVATVFATGLMSADWNFTKNWSDGLLQHNLLSQQSHFYFIVGKRCLTFYCMTNISARGRQEKIFMSFWGRSLRNLNFVFTQNNAEKVEGLVFALSSACSLSLRPHGDPGSSTNKVRQSVCSLRGKTQGKKKSTHFNWDESTNTFNNSSVLSCGLWWLDSQRTTLRDISAGKTNWEHLECQRTVLNNGEVKQRPW